MTKTLKTWTTLGVALIGGLEIAQAAPLASAVDHAKPAYLLVQDEGGEGGGEGGGGVVTTYKLDSADANAFKYDATAQTAAYADLASASYGEAVIQAKQLAATIAAMLAAPSEESLAAARAAWVAARPSYLKTEVFRFYDGPIEAIEGEINAWPMNEAFIDYVEGKADAGLINAKDQPLDIAALTGANQKSDEADVTTGWHAIEFLLWGQDLSLVSPGNRPHTDYTAGALTNERRRAYLTAVSAKLTADLEALQTAWAPGVENNYRNTFAKLEQREALGRMINGMAILAGFEFMSERLGVALDSGDQEDEHSCFSDTTKQDFVFDLVGIRQVWTGDGAGSERSGLNELIAAQDLALAARIDSLFADAEAKVIALSDPWDSVLASPKNSPEREAAEELLTALQELTDGLKEVGNTLGVLVLVPTG